MGAYFGCEAIISRLSRQVPNLMQLPLSDFSVEQTNGLGGDIARTAALLNLRDANLYAFIPKCPLELPGFFSPTNRIDAFRFGALPVVEYASISATNRQRSACAVVYGDSYTFALAPFIGYHFGESHIFRKNFSLDEVYRIKPNVVIEERAERWLHAGFYHG
jgi:hypothetical protein